MSARGNHVEVNWYDILIDVGTHGDVGNKLLTKIDDGVVGLQEGGD